MFPVLIFKNKMIFFKVASENQILSQTKLPKPIRPIFPAIEESRIAENSILCSNSAMLDCYSAAI